DDVNLLRRLAVQHHDLAEVEDARPIDRLITLSHHVHENVRAAEHAADAGRGVAESGLAVVAAEGFDLRLDDVADCRPSGRRHAPGAGRNGHAQQQSDEQPPTKRHDGDPTPGTAGPEAPVLPMQVLYFSLDYNECERMISTSRDPDAAGAGLP